MGLSRPTKQALFIPTTKSMATVDVAAPFLQHVVTVHGLPETLASRAPQISLLPRVDSLYVTFVDEVVESVMRVNYAVSVTK